MWSPCPGWPLKGFIYCQRCKCETAECDRARRVQSTNREQNNGGIWCSQCWARCDRVGKKKNKVMNAYGVQRVPGSWTPLMRAVGKLSYLWPSLEPCDVSAWLCFMQFLQANADWGSGFLAWAVLAYHCKWPAAVQALQAFLASRHTLAQPLRQLLSEPSPDILVEAFTSVILALDGQSLDLMHENISKVGHMHSFTGPVLFAASTGLIVRPNSELGFSPRPILKLGKGGVEFVLVVSDLSAKAFEALLSVSVAGVQAPEAPEQVGAFLAGLEPLAASLFHALPPLAWSAGEPRAPKRQRNPKQHDGQSGATYCRQGFTRKILLWLEMQLGPSCWDECPWKAVCSLLPDQAEDIQNHIGGEDTCKYVRTKFGFSPLMVSCWACYLHKVSTEDLAWVQGLPPLTVLRAADELKDSEGMNPSPARLYSDTCRQSATEKHLCHETVLTQTPP